MKAEERNQRRTVHGRKPARLRSPLPTSSEGSQWQHARAQHGRPLAFPDLVVIYLGMRVRTLRGLRTLISFGPRSAPRSTEGLLLHESLIYSLFPIHPGISQYWRDFQSLENWARSLPHQAMVKDYLQDSGGTGFWQ